MCPYFRVARVGPDDDPEIIDVLEFYPGHHKVIVGDIAGWFGVNGDELKYSPRESIGLLGRVIIKGLEDSLLTPSISEIVFHPTENDETLMTIVPKNRENSDNFRVTIEFHRDNPYKGFSSRECR